MDAWGGALLRNAKSVILTTYNRPSGDVEPSDADKEGYPGACRGRKAD